MNRERARELLPIIQAFAEGKEVEYRERNEDWRNPTTDEIGFYNHYEYRIKPEPKEYHVYLRNGQPFDVSHATVNTHNSFGHLETNTKTIRVREVE